MKDMILKPRVSEKAYAVSQEGGVYVFAVPSTANKQTVAQAVAAQYNVEVEKVNILVAKGKTVRSYRKRSRAVQGQRTNMKKAYVTLKAGSKLPIFESEEKETKPSKKAKEAK